MHKGLNSLIILFTWEIWEHRNTIVFEGARLDAPSQSAYGVLVVPLLSMSSSLGLRALTLEVG